MKKIIKISISILIFLFCLNMKAQEIDGHYYDKEEVEKILNLVVNSKTFDSVCKVKKVYFLENDIFDNDEKLNLKRKGVNVVVVPKENRKKNNTYYILGDFTLVKNSVRVQIEKIHQYYLINFLGIGT